MSAPSARSDRAIASPIPLAADESVRTGRTVDLV